MPVEQAYVPEAAIEYAVEPANQFHVPQQAAEVAPVVEPVAATYVAEERSTVEVPAQLSPELNPMGDIRDIASAARVMMVCRHDKLNQAT